MTFRLAFLYLLVPVLSLAQQDPINSQYMSNPLALNPSYAGIHNVTNLNLNTRFQWSSLQGSPTTYTFSGNTSIVNGKVQLLHGKVQIFKCLSFLFVVFALFLSKHHMFYQIYLYILFTAFR